MAADVSDRLLFIEELIDIAGRVLRGSDRPFTTSKDLESLEGQGVPRVGPIVTFGDNNRSK